MDCLLGIDVGTSSVKVLLLEPNGAILALSQRPYPSLTGPAGWAEQEPDAWWNATCSAIQDALHTAGIDARNVCGVGLSGQMHGLVLVNRDGLAMRKAIIWSDTRSQLECTVVENAVGRQRLHEITGLPVSMGFLAPSLLWTANHEPEIYERSYRALLPKDFIRHRLTGEFATDVSDASGTLLFDIRRKSWSREIVRSLGLREDLLPRILPSSAMAGRLTKRAAVDTGLPPGTPVATGSGDQAAGAVGSGLVDPGLVASVIGTGGQILTSASAPIVDHDIRIHTLCHAVDDTWLLMGATLAAGLSLRWFKEAVIDAPARPGSEQRVTEYDTLSLEAGRVEPGARGLLFLPYLIGERTPHMDPCARGCFVGLTLSHTRAHMVRAIMEGVTFAMNESLSIFRQLGVGVDSLVCSGGGARSKVWQQIQADIYGMPVTVTQSADHSAYGAALLGGVASNLLQDVREVRVGARSGATVVHPIPENVTMYERLYKVHRSLYPALRESFAVLAPMSRTEGMADSS